jgi:hypothetical protein
MKTKTYLGKVNERNEDMEYSCKFLFDTKGNPEARLEKITSTWRGSKMKYDPHLGGYWSDNTLIQSGGSRLVDPIDVASLRKYLATL